MHLTVGLAQGIVDNCMDVLGKNINIMDHNAIIIGSGNKDRINTLHEGAIKVIETGREFIVTDGDAEKMSGVKAGINLPIRFNNDIIGVVGITGKLDEVGSFGKIVKNLVELMLSNDFLQREMELENKAIEHYYQQLLSNNIIRDELLYDRAKLYNIDLDIYRVVLVIKAHPFNNRKLNSEIDTLSSLLNINNDKDIFFIRGQNLILIKSFSSNVLKEQSLDIKKLARLILIRFEKIFKSVEIGIGQIFSDIKKLYLSYEGAKHALEVGEKVYNSEEKIYFIGHLGYDYFIPYLENNSADYFLHHMLEKDITDVFMKSDTGSIIEALVDNNLNISKTAEALFIHRNTLLYRLNKIEEMIGLNPKNVKNLFTLLLAYHLYLYRK